MLAWDVWLFLALTAADPEIVLDLNDLASVGADAPPDGSPRRVVASELCFKRCQLQIVDFF